MTRRGWALFVAMSVIWGIPYLLIKVAVGQVSPAVLVFARTSVGAALLLPFAARRRQLGTLRSHWPAVLAFAAIEIAGPWLLLSDAERRLSSSTTGLLIAAVPIIGVVLARLTGDRRPVSAVRWLGLLLGLGGVALLAAPALHGGGVRPMAEVLLTALGYATAPLIADRSLRDCPSLAVTSVCLTVTALIYTPAAAATWPSRMPSASATASLAGLAAVCTAIAFVLFFELIGEVGAARATVITYVNPAVAVVCGATFLSEPLTATIGGSFVLILAGSVLATRRTVERVGPVAEPAGPVSSAVEARGP